MLMLRRYAFSPRLIAAAIAFQGGWQAKGARSSKRMQCVNPTAAQAKVRGSVKPCSACAVEMVARGA